MSHDSSIFSLLNLVESVEEITTTAAAGRVEKCEMSSWNRDIMIRIEGLLKHASNEYAKLMNDCRPINRMPPEILLLIFSFAGRGKSVVTVSHVCKWWRQLAISSPTLWTLYSTRRFSHLDIMLQRSRNALVDVQVDFWDDFMVRSLSPLRFQIGRLCTLDISFDLFHYSRGAATSVEAMFPSAALHLTRLSLSLVTHRGEVPSFEDTESSFTSLFGGAMPRLRILCLHRIGVWPQVFGPNLQFLILLSRPIPCLGLLSVLQTLPCLEVLVLDSFSFSGASSPQECVVMMERLRILHIRTEINTKNDSVLLCHFLSSLAMHAGIAVYLNVSNFSTAAQIAQESNTARPRNYSIDGMHSLCLDQEITVSDDRSFVTYDPSSYFNELEIMPNSAILFGLIYCRLAHITHLILHTRRVARLKDNLDLDWRTILGSMPLLESLIVLPYDNGSRDIDVFNILLEVDPITNIPRYASRLAEITIAPHFRHSSGQPPIREFIRLLSTRCASGYPIKQVTIVSYDVPTEDIEQIKNYVHEVTIPPRNGLPYPTLRLQIPRHLVRVQPENMYSDYFDF